MGKQKKILFYYTSNERSIAIESVMLGFKNLGHNLFLLTQTPEGNLHSYLKQHNITTANYSPIKKNAFAYYIKHIRFLIKFIKQHKIDIVYSHLQQANVVAVYASRFCKAKVYVCRHHSDTHLGENKNLRRFDKVINKNAKLIIAPSEKVVREIIQEGVHPAKIKLIRYGYDFSLYPKPNSTVVSQIRNTYTCDFLALSVARLVPDKRHEISIHAMKELVHSKQLNIKLLIISDGPEMEKLQNMVLENKLSHNVFLLGYLHNVVDYLVAANVVIQMAETEASNNLVKEAALFGKTVIVCKNVGDYDEYMMNGENAFLIEKNNPVPSLVETLENIMNNKYDLNQMGQNLHQKVIDTFAINNVISQYDSLNM